MQVNPQVSVVLPTYNRTALLPRAIRSVLAQTYKNLELIVVDDASTEDVRQSLAAFSDPRIRYLRRDVNGGAGAARNLGVREARGDWVAFQDSDDEWLITKLEQQVAAATAAGERPGPVLICGSYVIVRDRRGPTLIRPTKEMLAGRWDARTLYSFPFIAPTWLIRRDVFLRLGGFDEALPNLEDWELIFRLKSLGEFQVLEDLLVVKHTQSDSLNQDVARRLISLERILDRHQTLWATSPHVLGLLHAEIGRLRCVHGDLRGGRAALGRSLKVRPKLRTAAYYAASFAGAKGIHLVRRNLKP